MKVVTKLLVILLSLCGAVLPVCGGSYSQNFNSYFLGQTSFPDGSTLYSTESGYANAHVEDPTLKELQLSAWNIHNDSAAFLLPDLDPANRIYSFSASWIAPVYGNFPAAGEGFSFSFGPLRSSNLLSGSVESGYGVGLCFSVKTGTNSPGFYLLQNGAVIASQTNNPTVAWGNFSSTRHSFQVNWDNDTGLTVLWNGSAIFTNVSTGNYTPAAGDSFVWAARVSDSAATYRIDNVSVTTVAQSAPTIRAISATNQLSAVTNSSTVNFSSIRVVAADVNTRGLDTTVRFELGTNTSYGSSATKVLTAASGLNVNVTNAFAFNTDRQIPLHARVTASNALGVATSSDLVFYPNPFEERIAMYRSGTGAVWADMNDDGLLDLIVHGRFIDNASVEFFINQGSAPWIQYGAGFVGFLRSFASVGDFDNDNRPDVFFAGGSVGLSQSGYGERALITYGVTTNQQSQLGLPANDLEFPFFVDLCHSVVADFDHDGRQDILFTGSIQLDYTEFTNAVPDPLSVPGARLMHNEFPGARGGFHDDYFRFLTTTVLNTGSSPLFDDGFLSIGDLDGDGFPDVYNYGFPDPDSLQNLGWQVLRNDGEMGLAVTQKGNRQLGNAYYSGSGNVWADLNGDGFEDLVIAEGESAFTSFYATGRVQVLLNDGNGHLTNSGPPLVGMGRTDVAVGDIFNHGRNDIIVHGIETADAQANNFLPKVLIFRNDGNGVFTRLDYPFPTIGFDTVSSQGLSLADYDRDGRLDFSMLSPGPRVSVETIALPYSTAVFRNELNIASNAPPLAPTNLSTVVGPGTVTFHWGNATDDITPANLLTYNLRVGTNSLGISVVSPLADVTNGWRKIAAPGNCRHTFSTLYRFPPGTYYWSVQAVDGGFAGGAWAPEHTFTITDPERPLLGINANGSNQSTQYWPVRFADYNLQQSASLSPASWTSVTNAPYYDNGKAKVAVSNGVPARFFRLSKP